MPHLMVNLEDKVDCRRAMDMLRRRLHRLENAGDDASPAPPRSPAGSGHAGDVASLPLPQKLKRIQSRGMWKHLLRIAQSVDQPMSLPEIDEQLQLPKNKMRSLKANMARLENKFDLKFLRVDAEAGADVAGNPRYVMVPRVRNQILKIAKQTCATG